MSTFEKISNPEWKPFSIKTEKIFADLKKENFNPFALIVNESKLYDYDSRKEVAGYLLRSCIEDFFYKQKRNMFMVNNKLDPEFIILKENKDIDALRIYTDKRDLKDFLHSYSFNSNEKLGVSACQWYLFLQKFFKEFNININDIKFSSIIDDGSPVDKFDRNEELKKKELDILTWSVSINATLPELESLIKLGANPLNISKVKSFDTEENFFLNFLSSSKYSISIKSAFLEKMLDLEPKLINIATKKSYSNKNSLFIIMSFMKENEIEELCSVIYKKFKDNLKEIEIPDVKDNFGISIVEKNLHDFLINNSVFVRGQIEKEKIINSIKPVSSLKIKKRI